MQASIALQSGAPASDSTAELAECLLTIWRRVIQQGGIDTYSIFEELDVTLTQVKALTALADDELTVKELAERLGLSLPGASRAVDALVSRELMHRREDAEDRRMKRLGCTDAGRAALIRLDEAKLQGLEAFAGTLPGGQRRRLIAALRPIVDDMNAGGNA
ncbi:MAG: MarR family transcriptional regulator [Actinomycetota bacterium]|nr:MarR family transcriptional regulator [Actinomycetota bacterium]